MVFIKIITVITIMLFVVTITLKTLNIVEFSKEKYINNLYTRNKIITLLAVLLFFISIFYFRYIIKMEIIETITIAIIILILSLPKSRLEILIDEKKKYQQF